MATLAKRFDEIERAADIDARVGRRIGDALAHVDLRREMHDHIEWRLCHEARRLGGANVHLVEPRARIDVLALA